MAETGSAAPRVVPSWALPVAIGVGYLTFAQAIRLLTPQGFEQPVDGDRAPCIVGLDAGQRRASRHRGVVHPTAPSPRRAGLVGAARAFVLLGGIVGPLLSATVGTATGRLAFGRSWGGVVNWWVGDGLGALVIAPLFVAWQRRSSRRVSAELVPTVAVLLAVSLLVFRNWQGGDPGSFVLSLASASPG